MTWVKLVLALVQLANYIFGKLHDNAMIQEGEDRQIARAIAEMAMRSTAIKAAEERIAKASPSEILKELQDHGELRD